MEITRTIDKKTQYKKDRLLYIIQATVEYFITIMVGTTYLAKVAMEIGMDDATIALLTSVIHFSCAFQLLAIPLNKFKRPKMWLTPSLILIEISFTAVYLIPILPSDWGIRPILLVIAVILGNALHNINSAPKTSWMMRFVPDDGRGRFVAVMQMTSLIGGMIFSYVIGSVIDSFEARSDLRGAFIVSGILVAALSVIHVILFLSTSQITDDTDERVSVISQIKDIISNKNVLKILPLYFLYYVAMMCAIPFYSTYQIKELAFPMAYIALLAAIGSAVRAVTSYFFGKYGDKRGFIRLLNISYIILAISFLINIFTVPDNGKVMFLLYTVIHSVAMAGVGVSDTSLIFEYVPLSTRVGVMAIKGTGCGIISFVVTLAMSSLVRHIQENGNTFLGMNVYAQQVGSAIALIGVLVLIVYVNIVAKTAKNRHDA